MVDSKRNCIPIIALCLSLVVMPTVADDDSFAQAYEDTLTVYGNANSDDIIDEDDIEYVRGIIDGTKDEAQFADANYDGKIDEDDIAQIELIITGEEEELTILDMANRTVTVPMPVERVIPAARLDSTRALVMLGAKDKIVGCSYPTSWSSIWYAAPELEDLPDTGGLGQNFNVELAVSLEPDVIFVSTNSNPDELQEKSEVPTIAVGGTADGLWAADLLRIIGAVTGTDKRARDIIAFTKEGTDEIAEITSKMSDEDKPAVYSCGCRSYEGVVPFICKACGRDSSIDLAGGLRVIESASGFKVSKEQIIKWNPDVIFMAHGTSEVVGEVLSDPVLQNVTAVKNEKVYSTKGGAWGRGALGLRLCQAYYLAKLLHPEEFEYLDVDEKCNDIMEYLYGVDGIYTDMAEEYCLYRWD